MRQPVANHNQRTVQYSLQAMFRSRQAVLDFFASKGAVAKRAAVGTEIFSSA